MLPNVQNAFVAHWRLVLMVRLVGKKVEGYYDVPSRMLSRWGCNPLGLRLAAGL